MKNAIIRGGFTLVEYVIVLAVMGVIAAVLSVAVNRGVKAYEGIAVKEMLSTEAEHAAELMSREIRNAADASRIIEAGTSAFAFTDVYGNEIRFHAGGGAVMRNGLALAGNPGTLEFAYAGEAGQLPAPVDEGGFEDIRIITIRLELSDSGYSAGVETRIRPRNF